MSIRRAVLRLVSPCLPFAVLLSFAVSAAPPAAGPQGTSASVAPKVAGPLSPAQRGQLVRQFVLKWGNHVNRIYGVPARTWAMRMVPTFVAADPSNFRNALNRDTFEGAMAELSGRGMRLDDKSITRRLSGSPLRGSAAESVPAKLGELNQDLAYTPVQPCRIVDTRQTAAGQFAAAETRNFTAMNTSFTQQGGSSTDCGMHGAGASAVVINVVAVTPSGNGYATVYPFNTTQPVTSSLNYSAGVIAVSNSMITRVPNPLASADFSLYSSAPSHYVIDVVGYFAPTRATALQCIQSGYFNTTSIAPGTLGTAPSTLCPNGYTRVSTSCNVSSTTVVLHVAAIGGCQAFNHGSTYETVSAESTCCRVPGR